MGEIKSLMRKMLQTYAWVLGFGIFLLELQNILVNRISLAELLVFNIPFVLVGGAMIVGILQIVTSVALKPYKAFLQGDTTVTKELALRTLLFFPNKLFIGLMGFSLLFAVLYHLLDDFLLSDWTQLSGNLLFWRSLLISLLTEQLLALTLSVLLFIFSRRAIRPFILNLRMYSFDSPAKGSFVRTVLLTLVSAFAIASFSAFRYVLIGNVHQHEVDLAVLFMVIFMNSAIGIVVLYLLISEYRSELKLMTEGIISLSSKDRREMHGKIELMSLDEMGQLTEAFNLLQERMRKEYEELDKELRMAYKVQQQLLPDHRWRLKGADLVASCMQVKEVGGDFFDVIAADDGSFLVLIGDVSGKGLPAALLMSAVLTLFRSEAKHGGSADELLSRLNRQLVDALQGNLFVTAGIAAFERNGGMSYASAGHLAPYLIRRNGEVGMIPVSSLPLGIDESIGYESTYVRLEPGDRVFFYTDGVVEAPHPKGGIIGFDRLEQLLGQLPANLSPEEQMNALLAQLSFPETQADDDRTLLLVAVNE